ncbi:MAG: hypothetical protein ACFFCQ_02445 [Promethearchaeota archaeon]
MIKSKYLSFSKKSISLVFILIFLVNNIAVADSVAKATQEPKRIFRLYDLDRPLVILFDPTDQITNHTAKMMYWNFKQLYSNTLLLPVLNQYWLERHLEEYAHTAVIFIHIYQTDPTGVKLKETTISWTVFLELLTIYTLTNHILGMGNGMSAKKIWMQLDFSKRGFIHITTDGDVIDAEIVFFSVMWTCYSIFKEMQGDYQEIAEALYVICAKFLADNFDHLFQRSYDPQESLGERNLEYGRAVIEDYERENPAYIEEINDTSDITPPLTLLNSADVVPSDNEKITRGSLLKVKNDNRRNDVDVEVGVEVGAIGILPFDTGLNGPIGGVANPLLKVLLVIGNILGLPMDLIAQIIVAMESINKIAGIEDGSFLEGSPLYKFLNSLKAKFPFSDDLMPLFELIIDSFALLKGGGDEATYLNEFLSRYLDLMVSEQANPRLYNNISAIFGSSSALVAKTSQSGYYTEGLVSSLAGKYTEELTMRFLNTTLNLTQQYIWSYFPKLNATLQFYSNLMAERNLTRSLYVEFPQLIQSGLLYNILNSNADEDVFNAILAFLELVLNTLEYTNKIIPMKEALSNLLIYLLPPEITYSSATIATFIEKLIEQIDYAIQSQSADTETFEEYVRYTLATSLSEVRNTDWASFLTDLTLLLTGIYNHNFRRNENYPTISTLTEKMMGLFGEDNELIQKTIKTLINSLFGILALTTDRPEIKRLVKPTEGSYNTYVHENVSRFITDACELIFPSNVIETHNNSFQDLATISMGHYQLIVNGKDNPFQTVFQLVMLITGYGIYVASNEVTFSHYNNLVRWLFDSDYNEFEEQSFPYASFNTVLTELQTAIGDSDPYFAEVRRLMITLVQTKDLFINGIRWVYTEVMTWQERQVQAMVIDLLIEIYEAFYPTKSIIAKAKTKVALENLGYHEQLDNNPRFADLEYISMENNVITYRSPTNVNESREPLQSGNAGEDNRNASHTLALPFSYKGSFPLALGPVPLSLDFTVGLDLDVKFAVEEFIVAIGKDIFAGNKIWEKDLWEKFKYIMDFLYFTPLFFAELKLGNMSHNSTKKELGSLMKTFEKNKGKIELRLEGGGAVTLELFSFNVGKLEFSNAFKVREWKLFFTIQPQFTINIWDLIPGAQSVSAAMNAIGLDVIKLTIYLRLSFEIIRKYATLYQPEESSLTFTIAIGVTLWIGIKISSFFEASISITAEIALSFYHDLLDHDPPIEIFLDFTFTFKATLQFLFIKIEFTFTWKPIDHLRLTPGPDEPDSGRLGPDTDGDGLSDIFEEVVPGFDKNNPDTDGDGLGDKEEYYDHVTDPGIRDTDGDGLSDWTEVHMSLTNPRFDDTDFDGLNDFEEYVIYHTDPFEMDSDADGLTDSFEVKTAWDISNITPSVKQVFIGGVPYPNRTDPLNPDTDNDGLLDGEEGPRGIYYGSGSLFDSANEINPETGTQSRDSPREDAKPIIFNYGFTHPLDNDTDDDSYEQLWNGTISFRRRFLRSMTDGDEIFGMWITFINKYGEPTLNLTRTNPVCPDTDGDTGRWGPYGPDNIPPILFLNSDGYELSLDPPSDPNDGDSDDDGLIDGLEGTLRPDSNHTHYLNPDTDGDGLGDLQELQLGSNPRNVDTDHDMVSDGDEFFLFGTETFLPDSDSDGLTDGEEIYFFHSNPRLLDSDGDGIRDGAEVLDYGTDPMDEDTDNDGLTDKEEIKYYGTDPRNRDMDNDGLTDGEELEIYHTDPRNWDSDSDSITYLNEYGNLTYPLSDGDEVKRTKTDPTSADTDKDGLTDGWELYLASGIIPSYVLENPIALDPLSNDTDGDGLRDSAEIAITNYTSLIYPYIGFYIEYPFNSRPDKYDTDSDELNDFEEVHIYLTDPSNPDTDNDTFIDGHEVIYHKTDPLSNDTDGDKLLDWEELTNAYYLVNVPAEVILDYNPIYATNASAADTDGDLLPDGAEYFFYGTDPRNPDDNENGIPDGLDYDSDHDLLEDGYEYFGYSMELENGTLVWLLEPTTKTGSDGPFTPDSDHDGIADGLEFYGYGTNPIDSDTDGDGYSDGFEITLGTNPLVPTEKMLIYHRFDAMSGTVFLLLPSDTLPAGNIPIVAKSDNNTVTQVSYRVRSVDPYTKISKGWSNSVPLLYSPRYNQWEGYHFFVTGLYDLELIISDVKGKTYTQNFRLTIGEIPPLFSNADLTFVLGIITAITGFFGFTSFQAFLKRYKSHRKKDKESTNIIESYPAERIEEEC